jgi:hypothetical protein
MVRHTKKKPTKKKSIKRKIQSKRRKGGMFTSLVKGLPFTKTHTPILPKTNLRGALRFETKKNINKLDISKTIKIPYDKQHYSKLLNRLNTEKYVSMICNIFENEIYDIEADSLEVVFDYFIHPYFPNFSDNFTDFVHKLNKYRKENKDIIISFIKTNLISIIKNFENLLKQDDKFTDKIIYDSLRKTAYLIQPSSQPTGQPSSQPTGQPSSQPTGQPIKTNPGFYLTPWEIAGIVWGVVNFCVIFCAIEAGQGNPEAVWPALLFVNIGLPTCPLWILGLLIFCCFCMKKPGERNNIELQSPPREFMITHYPQLSLPSEDDTSFGLGPNFITGVNIVDSFFSDSDSDSEASNVDSMKATVTLEKNKNTGI